MKSHVISNIVDKWYQKSIVWLIFCGSFAFPGGLFKLAAKILIDK